MDTNSQVSGLPIPLLPHELTLVYPTTKASAESPRPATPRTPHCFLPHPSLAGHMDHEVSAALSCSHPRTFTCPKPPSQTSTGSSPALCPRSLSSHTASPPPCSAVFTHRPAQELLSPPHPRHLSMPPEAKLGRAETGSHLTLKVAEDWRNGSESKGVCCQA